MKNNQEMCILRQNVHAQQRYAEILHRTLLIEAKKRRRSGSGLAQCRRAKF